MEPARPKLMVAKESHPKLYFFARHHPEILQVFHNIENDVELTAGISLADAEAPDIINLYVDSLHVPLLLEVGAISRNRVRKCGFAPLVSGLVFRDYDNSFSAKIAANRAAAIAQKACQTDPKGESLYCYYHGAGEDPAVSARFIAEIKSVIMKYCTDPSKDLPALEDSCRAATRFDFVFSARVERPEVPGT
jgi:hypothetical protein